MKPYTLTFILILFMLLGTLEANKKNKKAKHYNREYQSLKKKHQDWNVNSVDNVKKEKAAELKSHKLHPNFGKKLYKGKKNAMKKSHKAVSWLNFEPDVSCDFKCKEDEVCITGLVVNKPICVHKKDLKNSVKLFHRYHKKEMKAWKKYMKRNYKTDWKMKEEKYGRMKSHYLASLKKAKLEKLGKGAHFSKNFHKKVKHHPKLHPKYASPVCGTIELGQLKSRMMAWFHLLHGQDHKSHKSHKGDLVKFYKHQSVKKELREYKGEKCECMKSAMWQFQKMDVDHDNHLTDKELTMLKENSLEPCMSPYLKSCDRSGDKILNRDEWCCCFTNILPPCYRKLNEIRKSGKPVTYMPRCDKEGYYMQEQCKGTSKAKRVCWCTDYNGNEYKDTARNGRAHCNKIKKYADKKKVPLV